MILLALICTLFAGFIGMKVDCWTTLRRLGLASECPGFSPPTYGIWHLAMWALFLAMGVTLFMTNLAWWMCLPLVFAVVSFSLFLGHKAALRKYREVLRTRLAGEKGHAKKQAYRDELAMSDLELLRWRADRPEIKNIGDR